MLVNCTFFHHAIMHYLRQVSSVILNDAFCRIPSYFGTMPAADAARQILDGVRRNYAEFSVPGYLLYLAHVLRYFSPLISLFVREIIECDIISFLRFQNSSKKGVLYVT